MNQPEYDFDDLVRFGAGSVLGTISLALIGFAGCSVLSKLGEPAIKGCQAINLMLSLPSGTIIVLFLILAGIIIKSAGGTEGRRARA